MHVHIFTSTSASGDLHVITLTDMFGFECFHRNRTEQLMINSLNEQIQYHYNQRMFVWEMLEQVIYTAPIDWRAEHLCVFVCVLINLWVMQFRAKCCRIRI